jgi:integral membrane sensor domain MASE1
VRNTQYWHGLHSAVRIRLLLRFVMLVGVYLAGAVVATWFVRRPDQVALIWPPTGFAFAVLVCEGLAWWPVMAVGIVLLHLLVQPVPVEFIPFSVAANVISTVAAAWLVRRYWPWVTRELSVRSGFALLRGALVLVLISGLIGVAGMVYSGMLPATEFWDANARWAMGNLFGLIAVTPAVLVAERSWNGVPASGLAFRYAGTREKLLWTALLPLSLVVLLFAGARGAAYALGTSSISLAILLWSALRFEPIYSLPARCSPRSTWPAWLAWAWRGSCNPRAWSTPPSCSRSCA